MEWTSNSESPDKLHFWTAVSTVAGALRRRVWIDMRIFKWVPNFYIIMVGPAGTVNKSTSISLGYRLLTKVKRIKFGPTSASWQSLLDAFGESVEFIDLGPGQPPLKMSALTIVISELGTFLRTDQDDYMSFLIDMWDGKEIPVERRTRQDGASIHENTWLNVIAATTPEWLQANMPVTLAEGGLASRIVFVYADTKRKLVPWPDETIPDADYRRFQEALVEDLSVIATLKGEYRMTPDAREWGREWYVALNNARPLHLTHKRYGGYLSRKQTHMMKLALIFAAARRDELRIELDDMQKANECLTMIEADMARVFESIGLADSAQKLNTIMSLLKVYKKIENATLWRSVLSTMSDKEYQEALFGGVKAGLIKVIKEDNKTYITLP